MKMNRIIGGSVAVAAALALSTQAQNLLVNQSFEDVGGFTPNPITLTSAGGLSGVNQGWATFGTTGQADLMATPLGGGAPSPIGLLMVNAVGNNWNPAGAYQIISGITPGQKYNFTVTYASDTGVKLANSGVMMQMNFQVADPVAVSLGTVENPMVYTTKWSGGTAWGTSAAIVGSTTWYTQTISGTAPISTPAPYGAGLFGAPAAPVDCLVYLMFMDNGQTQAENVYFDNAILVAAPEPTTLALMGLGLAVPFFFRRKS